MHFGTVLLFSKRVDGGTGKAQSVNEPAGEKEVKRLKVLVVDDDRDLADLAVELLRMYRVDALVAYSGKEALMKLRDDPHVNAVFSDVMMPNMNGLELARTITNQFPSVNVVLASGRVFPNLNLTSSDFPLLTKPYRIEVVLEMLRGGLSTD